MTFAAVILLLRLGTRWLLISNFSTVVWGPKLLDRVDPCRGQDQDLLFEVFLISTSPTYIHIRHPRAITHSALRPTMARSESSQPSASSRNLIEPSHSSVPNNIPVNSGRLIGRSLWAHRQREEASRRSLHSEASSHDSSDLDDLVNRHLRDHV